MPGGDSQRWLILVHQLPAEPSNVRVKVWRRLQAVGAVLVKNSVYALPASSQTREDFEWIRGEIAAHGGTAMVFAADAVDDLTGDEVVEAFREARREDWAELERRAGETAQAAEGDPPAAERREVEALRHRASQIDEIDFFKAPGREEALRAVEALDAADEVRGTGAADGESAASPEDYGGRVWVTRPRPGVDRMASAWLIRRFVDSEAEFAFAEAAPADGEAVPFDMYGVMFGHHGDRCTFETLVAAFGLVEPALAPLARIVHDLDLRKAADDDLEAATVGRLVEGLRDAIATDAELLEQGITVFDALYRSYARAAGGP